MFLYAAKTSIKFQKKKNGDEGNKNKRLSHSFLSKLKD